MLLAVILCTSFALAEVSSVSLTSPAAAAWTNDTTPSFVFTATSNSSADSINCTLYINDTQKAQNTSVFNATATTLTASTLTDGALSWRILCIDGENSTNSSARVLNLDSVAPSVTLTRTPNNPETRKSLTATCSATDSTSSTLTYLITLTHPNGATTYTSTSTSYKFSGSELPVAGTYTLDCAVTDQGSNVGSATQQVFRVQNDLAVQQISENETTTTSNNNLLIIFVSIVVVIILGYVLTNNGKKKK